MVIKNGNTITYFGGKAQQMEKATRVKARVKAQALKEFMSTKDRVVVMGHKITDVDALRGSHWYIPCREDTWKAGASLW